MKLNNIGRQPKLPDQVSPAREAQQSVPAPSSAGMPVVRTVDPAANPLSSPANPDLHLSRSEPRPSVAGVPAGIPLTPETFKAAIESGDSVAILRHLDQGISPNLVVGKDSLLHIAIEHVRDEKILNRILETAGPEERQLNCYGLYHSACQKRNGPALKCLLLWKVPKSKIVAKYLPGMLLDAVKLKESDNVVILLQIYSKNFANCNIRIKKLFKMVLKTMDLPTFKALTEVSSPLRDIEIDTGESLLAKALNSGNEAFAAHIVTWLRSYPAFAECDDHYIWPLINNFSDFPEEKLLMLVRIGYPVACDWFRAPKDEQCARRIQEALLGKNLEQSNLASEMSRNAGVPISLEWLSRVYGISLPDIGLSACEHRLVEGKFLLVGFRPPAAKLLSRAIASGVTSFKMMTLPEAGKIFILCSQIIECSEREELSISKDSLVSDQVSMLNEMANREIQQLLGRDPAHFFVQLVECIDIHGINNEKIITIVRNGMGFPPSVVEQIRHVLLSARQEARKMPMTQMPDPGVSIEQFLAVLNRQVNLATLMAFAKTLPVALNSWEHRHKANDVPNNMELLEVMHGWTNSAIMVLTAYCSQMMEDPDLKNEIENRLAADRDSADEASLPFVQPALFLPTEASDDDTNSNH